MNSDPRPDFPFLVDVAFMAGDIVFATDKSGSVVYWNKEAEAVSGYSVEEVLGKPYTFACRMEPGVSAPDLPAILTGRDFAGGVRCHSRNGGDATLYLFATAGRNPAGEPAGVVFVGRDVTGLWQAEAAAQASADKYRVLFENNLDSVAIADMDGKVLEANPAWLHLYGYTADNVKGTSITEVVAPEDRSAAGDAMAKLAAGRPVARTIRMRRKDGTRLVADLVASFMVVGGERRIMSVTRDVTDRVRAEQARSQSERTYRTFFESANDAVFIETVNGRILDVNRNGCELLGYQRDELVGMSVSDLVPPEASAWLPRVTDAILRAGTFRAEAVNVHKSGRRIPVEISASTMEMDGKTVVLAILRDISERKRAEQVLRESEEKFRSVSEQSPNMIFINSRRRVVYANQKSADVMAYTREELYAPAFDFMRLIAPESAEQIKSVYARHERGEEVEPYEYTLVTRDGRRIESIITTRLIEYGGSKAILGIVTDVTERRVAERARLESERQYHTALDAMHDPVHVADAELRIVLVNQAFRRWLVGQGIDQEVLGKTVFDAFPFLPAKVREEYQYVFGSGRPLVTEEETTVAGRTYSTETTKVPITEGDKVARVLTVLRDTTERRAAEQALRESEEKYRSVVERASDGICVIQEGRLKYVNRALAEMAGYSAEELVGNQFLEYLHPEDRAVVADRYGRRLRGEKSSPSYTVRFLRRDGSAMLVEVNAALSVYEGASADIVLVRDISERERAEQALAASEERYRNLVESSPDGIAVCQDGVVVLANRASVELLGYDNETDLIGRRAESLVSPDDRPQVDEHGELLRSGAAATATLKVKFLSRNGDSIPVEVVGVSTIWRGKPATQITVRPLSSRPS